MFHWTMLRTAATVSLLGLTATVAVTSISDAHIMCDRSSCLLAQDINDIRLGMSVQEVAKLVPGGLEPLGYGQFEAKGKGLSYKFGFSPLGRLFQINSSQELGTFAPDYAFSVSLQRKLESKFGKPHAGALSSGAAFWEFAEHCMESNGVKLTCETESLSASLSGGLGDPISLEIVLRDFRILRGDAATLNIIPQAKAKDRVQF